MTLDLLETAGVSYQVPKEQNRAWSGKRDDEKDIEAHDAWAAGAF